MHLNATQRNAASINAIESGMISKVPNTRAPAKKQKVSNAFLLFFMTAKKITKKLKLKFNKDKNKKNTSMGIKFKNFFRKNNILVDQDFMLPPPGYSLLNFEMASTYRMKRNELQFSISMDNILNAAYRDYLNRLRDFADETGRNTSVRIWWIF